MALKINLLQNNLKKKSSVGLGLTLVTILGALLVYALAQYYFLLTKEIVRSREVVLAAKKELGQYAPLLSKKKELDDITKTVTNKQTTLGQNGQPGWGAFLHGLVRRVPAPVTLSEITGNEKGDILILGSTESLTGLADLVEALEGSGFLEDLAVSWVTAGAAGKSFTFELTARRHGLPRTANPPVNGGQPAPKAPGG